MLEVLFSALRKKVDDPLSWFGLADEYLDRGDADHALLARLAGELFAVPLDESHDFDFLAVDRPPDLACRWPMLNFQWSARLIGVAWAAQLLYHPRATSSMRGDVRPEVVHPFLADCALYSIRALTQEDMQSRDYARRKIDAIIEPSMCILALLAGGRPGRGLCYAMRAEALYVYRSSIAPTGRMERQTHFCKLFSRARSYSLTLLRHWALAETRHPENRLRRAYSEAKKKLRR